MAGNPTAGMRDDSAAAAGGPASVGAAIRDGAGDRRNPRPPVSYGHARADGRNPAGQALLDSQPATDRPGTVLYQDHNGMRFRHVVTGPTDTSTGQSSSGLLERQEP